MEYYNYAFLDPRKSGLFKYDANLIFEYEPFYVGKGKNNRYTRHLNISQLNSGNNNIKNGKLKHIIENGFDPLDYVVKLNANLTAEQAAREEIRIIKTIGRITDNSGPLTNLTDGGEGMLGNESALKGKTYEEIFGIETAKRLKAEKSRRFKGSNNPQYGKPSHFRGKTLSHERKQLLSNIRSKKIDQFDLDGNFISTWDSTLSAGRALSVAPTAIGNCLAGRSKTSAKSKWKYHEERSLSNV